MVTEWRQQSVEPAREHGFAGAGWANEQQVMRTSCGDLQRPLTLFLADDIADVTLVMFGNKRLPNGRGQLMTSLKKSAYFLEVFSNQAAFFFNKADFSSIISGDDNLSPGAYSRQSARYRARNPS